MAYLKAEMTIEKHVWLKEDYTDSLLEAAKENPLETLGRWQKVSGDYSFKPSVTENPLQKEQAEGRHLQENHKALEAKILAYLQSEVSPEKHIWLKEKLCRNIFNVAEKDPITGLKEWQDLSNDYSFNPFREYLSEREIYVQDYLQKALVRESTFDQEGDKVSPKKYKEILSNLLDKPFEAYQQWHHLTGDKTFDPASGIPRIEMEAQALMLEARKHVSEEIYKGWQENLTHSPQTIIKECHELHQAHQPKVEGRLPVGPLKSKNGEASKKLTHDMETQRRDLFPSHEMDR